MVNEINRVLDAHARQWLADWMSEAFQKDNFKFKPALFKKAVENGKTFNANPVFQQRHFYYLAHLIKQIDDPHIHDFVRNWLAEAAGSTNPQFKRNVWDKFCEKDDAPKALKKDLLDPGHDDLHDNSDAREGKGEVDEGYGGAPGFGRKGHGGFGQKIFRRAHYQFIAWQLHHLSDPTIRDHLTKWFEEIFRLDNPNFKPDEFEQAVMSLPTYRYSRPHVEFQQRHFYYLAHEVSEIKDKHEREFLCDWLADNVGSTNGYFNEKRWKEYCNLSDDTWDVKQVRHNRAKARGDKDIPESPHDEARRLEREKATILTPEEFHTQATCYDEQKGELEGHDLVYMRLQDGEYQVYDKTTGKEHWCVDGVHQWNND